jgi:carbamate kinase
MSVEEPDIARADLPPLLVVALGGNAMQAPDGDDSVDSDWARTTSTTDEIVRLTLEGHWRLVVTHGNGPQVGNHLLRSELGHTRGGLPLLPLEVCVADTQGGMGYMLQQCLANSFHAAGVPAVVASVVTQVLVDRDDPAFDAPSKPVGEIIDDARAVALRDQGWALAQDVRRGGWRRIVASPEPREIVEAQAIWALIEDGVVVVACGGGGIPVVQDADGDLSGVAAVVDKDLASALLAADLGASALLVVTDVPHVSTGYGTEAESPLRSMTVGDARALAAGGEFPPGSMGPKVEAVARFVEATGRRGVITNIEEAAAALAGTAGTTVTP